MSKFAKLQVLTRSGGTPKINSSRPFRILAARIYSKVLWQPFYETLVLPEKTWMKRSTVLEPIWGIRISCSEFVPTLSRQCPDEIGIRDLVLRI